MYDHVGWSSLHFYKMYIELRQTCSTHTWPTSFKDSKYLIRYKFQNIFQTVFFVHPEKFQKVDLSGYCSKPFNLILICASRLRQFYNVPNIRYIVFCLINSR